MSEQPPAGAGGIADAVAALTARLRADLGRIWDRVLAAQARLVERWPRLSPAARRAALRELQATAIAAAAAAERAAATQLAQALSGPPGSVPPQPAS